jgi:sec-independent protein translocase protein TatC
MTQDEDTMSLLEHLEELRSRLIKVVISVVLAAVVGFILARPVIEILMAPLPDEYERLVILGPADAFSVQLKVAVFLGIAFAMPVILFHIWRFVTPGLTSGERRFVWPAVLVAMLLFVLGMGVGYLVLSYALTFLLGFAEGFFEVTLTAERYIGFVTTMLLAFGLVFEFPVVLIGLSRVGILSYRRLAAQRRWALLGIVVAAVLLTPGGDVFSPMIMSGLMYVLFEGSLLVIRFSRRG